jgi:hypothetical protein
MSQENVVMVMSAVIAGAVALEIPSWLIEIEPQGRR